MVVTRYISSRKDEAASLVSFLFVLLLLLTYHVDSGSRPAQNSVNMQREVITGCPRPISVKVSSWCV